MSIYGTLMLSYAMLSSSPPFHPLFILGVNALGQVLYGIKTRDSNTQKVIDTRLNPQ